MKYFKNKNVYVEGKGVIKTNLLFDSVILNIGKTVKGEEIEIPEDSIVVPGFIDEHTHGAGSADAMDATIESLETFANTIAKEGTTSFCPTTMTQSKEAINSALSNIYAFMGQNKTTGARVLGAHLEGPFISKKYKGAQKDDYIIKPDLDTFKEFNKSCGGNIKIVSLAVEEEGSVELIKYLNENHVVASVGHSNAAEKDIELALQNGLRSVTHSYNAQSPLHHREIGVVGSNLLYDSLNAELICDTIHVSVPAIKLMSKVKPLDKLTLITDSIRAKGLGDCESELGGQKVIVKNGEARLEDGTLAGSVLKMNDAVKNLITKCGIEFTKVIDYATINPAKNMYLDNEIGSIKVGKKADFAVLDKDYNVILTIRDGNIIYKR